MKAIQYTEQCAARHDAEEVLKALSKQTEFLGGRTYWGGGGWVAQVFFDATGVQDGDDLPFDFHLVTIPESIASTLGITRPEVIDGLDSLERSYVAAGRPILAIKELRSRTGKPLKDSKDVVDAYVAKHGQGVHP
jgi:hypothetical protein